MQKQTENNVSTPNLIFKSGS